MKISLFVPFFCHFLLLLPSSIPIRKQKTLYSGWRRAWWVGRRWHAVDGPFEMKARPSSLSSGVCARAVPIYYPNILFVFVAKQFHGRRPSHHPRLYNVIRVHICSIQYITCSFCAAVASLKQKWPSGDVIKTDGRFLFPYIFFSWAAIFSLKK